MSIIELTQQTLNKMSEKFCFYPATLIAGDEINMKTGELYQERDGTVHVSKLRTEILVFVDNII